MRTITLVALLVLAAAPGCGTSGWGYIISQTMPQPTRTVPAEFAHLAGHKLAIVVWTHPSTELAYPGLHLDLARYTAKEIQDKISKTTAVPQGQISQYQEANPHWSSRGPADLARGLARRTGCDALLYVTVNYASLNQPGQLYYVHGRIRAKCELLIIADGGVEKVWDKDDLDVEYPKKSSNEISTDESRIRSQLLARFAEVLAKCFYKHEEPVE